MGNENIWADTRLFHYTDFSALSGILENGELWLCNVFSMNDQKEMLYFMELLKKAVLERAGRKYHTIGDLFEQQINRLKDRPVYAVSFSRNKDDASQWERYGASGYGVSVEFDAEVLSGQLKESTILQPIFYVTDVSASPYVDVIAYYATHEFTLPEGWDSIDSVFENAWATSSGFKHRSFASENEIRATALPFTIEATLGRPRFKPSKRELKEFYAINLRQEDGWIREGLIRGVTIGPRSDVNVDTMRRYLESIPNLDPTDIEVEFSDCPLR